MPSNDFLLAVQIIGYVIGAIQTAIVVMFVVYESRRVGLSMFIRNRLDILISIGLLSSAILSVTQIDFEVQYTKGVVDIFRYQYTCVLGGLCATITSIIYFIVIRQKGDPIMRQRSKNQQTIVQWLFIISVVSMLAISVLGVVQAFVDRSVMVLARYLILFPGGFFVCTMDLIYLFVFRQYLKQLKSHVNVDHIQVYKVIAQTGLLTTSFCYFGCINSGIHALSGRDELTLICTNNVSICFMMAYVSLILMKYRVIVAKQYIKNQQAHPSQTLVISPSSNPSSNDGSSNKIGQAV